MNHLRSIVGLLLTFSTCVLKAQLPQRPQLMPTGPTLHAFNFYKIAFHADGKHIILYIGTKRMDTLIVKATRYDWHTGLPDSIIELKGVDEGLFNNYRRATDYDMPAAFAADEQHYYDYPDGSKSLRTSDGTQFYNAKATIYKMKKGKLDYALIEKKWVEPDMLQYKDIPVCPTAPVCALTSFRDLPTYYGKHQSIFNVIIYDVEADSVLCRLYDPESLPYYQNQLAKYLIDSANYVENKIKGKESMDLAIKGLQDEGWRIEQIKYGLGEQPFYATDDGLGIWDFVPKPGRMYCHVSLMTNKDLSQWMKAYRKADMELRLDDSLFAVGHAENLNGTPLWYMLSHAFYATRPNDSVQVGIGFACAGISNECLTKEMADSNKLCRLLLSKERTAARELTINSLKEKIQVLDINKVYVNKDLAVKKRNAEWAAYEKEKKQQELAAIEKEKQAKAQDEDFRKRWIATIKKGLKPGQKAHHEVLLKELGPNEALSMYTDLPPEYRRTIYVLTNDTSNFMKVEYASDDADRYMPLEPNKQFNLGRSYRVTTAYWIGPMSEFRVSAKEDKPIRVTALVVVQKDEATYATYKAKMNEIDNHNAKARSERDSKFYRENSENDTRVNAIRSAFESFADRMNSQYRDAFDHGDDWSLNQQIDAYNKANTILKQLESTLKSNIPRSVTLGNPSGPTYKKWFEDAQTVFNEINSKLKEISTSIDEKKDSRKPALSAYISVPLMDMESKARSFLRVDKPR